MKVSDSQESAFRIGCGALVGAIVGVAIVVGTLSFWSDRVAAFLGVVSAAVVAYAGLGWRYGDRFFHSIQKRIEWFR